MFQINRIAKRKAGRGFTHKSSLFCLVNNVTEADLNRLNMATEEPNDVGIYYSLTEIKPFETLDAYFAKKQAEETEALEQKKVGTKTKRIATMISKLTDDERKAILESLETVEV